MRDALDSDMSPRALAKLVPLLFVALSLGCSSEVEPEDDGLSETEDALVGRLWGGWTPPLLAGTTYSGVGRVADRSPAWDGGRSCSGSLKPGSASLGKHLKEVFPRAVGSVGGYNCRSIVGNPSRMSMHGTGRALDVMIRNSDAASGDAIADYIVRNAPVMGVERVIWRKTHWMAVGVAAIFFPYGGSDPHTDHLHVELSANAAEDASSCHSVVECVTDLFQGDRDGE